MRHIAYIDIHYCTQEKNVLKMYLYLITIKGVVFQSLKTTPV